MNRAVVEKHAALVEQLHKKTLLRQINWELSDGRNPKASIGSYVVSLWEGRSGGSPVEYVSLNTPFDEHIETVSDESLDELALAHPNFESYFSMMEATRLDAFRQAVGADRALDEILNQLGSSDS